MIASCHRLLSEERPEQGEVIHARSAHIASLGRDMRSKYCRLLLTENDLKALNALPSCTSETLLLRDRKAPSNIVSSIVHIGEKDNPIWVSDLVLPAGELDHTAFAVRAPGAGQLGDLNAKEFEAVLVAMGLIDLRDLLLHSDDYHHLLIGDGNDWELLWIYGEQAERKTIGYTTLQLPADKQRLPDAFTSLAIRKVGIVGCGSIGSKIAASLCRSGVSDFFLIDEDIFLPGNIIRNELDLDSSGTHKVKALRDRLIRINPSVDVKTLQITLGGQESAKSMAGALEQLGNCDLLIDATAEPTAFNMIASVATRKKVPMVWVEVFAGGIGGIVARSRPDIDPVPLAARAQIVTWCEDQNIEWVRPIAGNPYEQQDAEGTPQIASDAEISIMAGHATRFATDLLSRPIGSIFPMSAYVVGFSSEWLFDQPFDTRPIDLQPAGAWGGTAEELEPGAVLRLLNEHLSPSET